MRIFLKKIFLSLSMLLVVGMVVSLPLNHIQAATETEPGEGGAQGQTTAGPPPVALFTVWRCESNTNSNEYQFSTENACKTGCLNSGNKPGTCTKFDDSPTPGRAPEPVVQPVGRPVAPVTTQTAPSNQFVPLTNLPGLVDETGKRTLADYLNVLFRLAIGIGALIAVIKITFAGIKYMGNDAGFSSKEEAKKDITGALFGLLIMLSTVVILQLIYPDILNLNVLKELRPVEVVSGQPSPGTRQVPAEVVATEAGAAAQRGERLASSLDVPTELTFPEQVKLTDKFRKECAQQQGRMAVTSARAPGPKLIHFTRLFCFTKGAPAPEAEPH